ncbi:Proteasome activator BLM10, partial [Coemansia nantahalensis]
MRLNEINWANQLPYDRGDEDAEFVREFVAQFKLSALSGDLPALSAMVVQLDRQVNEDTITPSDMSLDWRKLYDLMCSLLRPKIWQDGPIQQRFFPASVAMDVFAELLPQIQFNSLDWQIPTIQMLNLFVPTARAPKGTTPTSSGPASTDPKRWLPTVFSLWSFNLRVSGYDGFFMRLVTTLVVEQRGQLRLTNEQIRFAFASGLHCFSLPVAGAAVQLWRHVSNTLTDTSPLYRMPPGGVLPLREERAQMFARMIVYTLRDDEPGGTLDLFGQLVQMIEPFFHPSNNGSWSSILARFLRHLARELLQRTRNEAFDGWGAPADTHLARHIRRRFVVLVRALAMLLLFSKSEDIVSMSHSTLKHLAELEPDLIFRPLLDTLYTAIDSVTETHRMISAMRALGKLATTLSNFAHYPEGAQHVAPLLTLTLPGIDVNDPVKSCSALSFVSNLCYNGVVFEELAAPGDMPGLQQPPSPSSTAIGEEQDVDEPPEVDMAQIEWLTRASTAQFEAWIDQYLRRVFALVDNLSSSLETSNASSTEVGLGNLAAHTTNMVLHQCSERYHPMVTRLITRFATSITSLSAVGSVRKVVSAFATAIPGPALASLLPLCCERIAEEIENGVGLAPSLSRVAQSHAETTLIWFVSLLVALVEGQDGRQILRYQDQLLATMDLLLGQCLSRHVYDMASSLLYHVLSCLTRTSPLHGRSVPASQWANPEFRENHFRYWGQHPDVASPEFTIEWHVPSAAEVEFAQKILRQIVQPRVSELDEFIDALAGGREPTDREN